MRGKSAKSQLTLADLRALYEEGLASGADAAFRKRRWGRAAEFAGWLEQEALASLELPQALQLYRASGGRRAAEFAGTSIEELRDSLDFLLYDTIKLEGRFDECASDAGAYRLPGAGRDFVSWLLCMRNPALLGVWNRNAERMLIHLGSLPETMKRGPEGIRYLDMMEALSHGSSASWDCAISLRWTFWPTWLQDPAAGTVRPRKPQARSLTMPWRDSLLQLKEELSSVRASRLQRLEAFDRQVSAEREELMARQESLQVAALVSEMNDVLLDGQGLVETTVEWENEDEDRFEGEDDMADVITTALTWNEGEELEVLVELVMLDDGLALMVNGVQTRQDQDALQRSLIEAFREQLEV